ncbi:hypothetical protein WH95_18625 [Kiloniella litopenaei]|uniref:Lipoprotein n=1 Tax=Kiloniella litopenaei TaxID=1549748 RepID=A0A0M2R1D3_9PROT|nr:hypothetical protein [Kiloniella litopenaei]KKJ75456.1 hypothetical protein WH95_18625 [Kiloniella litopenaei]
MKNILMTVALVAAFFVSACTTPGGNKLTPEQQLQLTCDGISSTIKVLAGYRAAGELSEDSVKLVNDLRPSTVALCDGSVTDYQSALTILSNTAFTLLTIRKGAES